MNQKLCHHDLLIHIAYIFSMLKYNQWVLVTAKLKHFCKSIQNNREYFNNLVINEAISFRPITNHLGLKGHPHPWHH